MKYLYFCLTTMLVVGVRAAYLFTSDPSPLSDEFIDSINKIQSTWTAGRNFDEHTSMSNIRRLMGALRNPKKVLDDKPSDIRIAELPDEFDSRQQWSYCPTIAEIRDQGSCGSCWAVATVEAMTDRICIHSKGEVNFYFSADDVISCCYECGNGCNGGYADGAWWYWIHYGVVSGGPYGSDDGCRPYEIAPCSHHINSKLPSCEAINSTTPKCLQKCEKTYKVEYEEDLKYGQTGYYLKNNVSQIQAEIKENGPVVAIFNVYEDFLHYKKGVYQHVQGNLVTSHAIKIFGWGSENGVPFWNVANSWNAEWGDDGTFKILRGSNHVGIEEHAMAGIPRY